MPTISITVIKAFDTHGGSLKRKFSVYVRLQGQSMRTRVQRPGQDGAIVFNERFPFQFHPQKVPRDRNLVSVELWLKGIFSESCFAIAWLNLDNHTFTRGVQQTFNINGAFEGNQAIMTIGVTAVDFGLLPPSNPAASAPLPQQIPMAPGGGAPPVYGTSVPAMGIPLYDTAPSYTTAQYVPNGQQQVISEPLGLPPPQYPTAVYGYDNAPNPNQNSGNTSYNYPEKPGKTG